MTEFRDTVLEHRLALHSRHDYRDDDLTVEVVAHNIARTQSRHKSLVAAPRLRGRVVPRRGLHP